MHDRYRIGATSFVNVTWGAEVVGALAASGRRLALLSGDRPAVVAGIAAAVGITFAIGAITRRAWGIAL